MYIIRFLCLRNHTLVVSITTVSHLGKGIFTEILPTYIFKIKLWYTYHYRHENVLETSFRHCSIKSMKLPFAHIRRISKKFLRVNIKKLI